MRIITRHELVHRSSRELAALYAWVAEEMHHLPLYSPEWQKGMITLETIRAAQAVPKALPRPRGP